MYTKTKKYVKLKRGGYDRTKEVIEMVKRRNQKTILIWIIMLIVTLMLRTTVMAVVDTEERREIERSTRDEATEMSKEDLEEAIEALEEEIAQKREENDDYIGSDQATIDRLVLKTYKEVLQTKVGGNSYERPNEPSSPVTDPILNPSSYDPSNTDSSNHKTARIIGELVGIVRVVGTVVSLIVVVILGIKYMFGSTENKAKYKESMVPYVVGVVMLVAVVNILGILYKIFFNI